MRQSIILPDIRIPAIFVRRNDVIVARQYDSFFIAQKLFGTISQVLHPAEFVIEFLSGKRVAVWQIDRRHAHRVIAACQDFNITGLVVVFIAWETTLNVFDLRAGKNCDAIIALLAMRFDLITELFDFHIWKSIGLTFDLLQTNDVAVDVFQNLNNGWQARFDGIDVPCRNFHWSVPEFGELTECGSG